MSDSYTPATSGDGELIAYHLHRATSGTFVHLGVNYYVGTSGPNFATQSPYTMEECDSSSFDPVVAADGSHIAFTSGCTNLTGDAPDGHTHCFAYSVENDTHELISKSTAGVVANASAAFGRNISISSTGRFVVFVTAATNLVSPSTAGQSHVYVRDRDTDEDDVFDESGGVATYIVSRQTGTTYGDQDASEPSISADGRFVAFRSSATNLTGPTLDTTPRIYVHDLDADNDGIFGEADAVSTWVVNGGPHGSPNGDVRYPRISGNRRWVIFQSQATNLDAADEYSDWDIYVAHVGCGPGGAYLPCDADCSGPTDNFDIDAFVLALTDPEQYASEYPSCDPLCTCDLNQDGAVNNFDINPFVACIGE
ncbi:MAG: hypothetical protein AB7Q17_17395 [Phycisphaerae bacterium]